MAPLRIVIAPDSFTGFCSAAGAAGLLRDGIVAEGAARGVALDVVLVPMADGGTGTLDVVAEARGGARVTTMVKDPLGAPIQACYLRDGGGDVLVEMARASGIEHLTGAEDRRHPFLASTFGTGELLLHAAGAIPPPARIVVGLGGSGTNDGGIGLAQALGARVYAARGVELAERRMEGYGLAAMLEAASVDLSGMLELPGIELVAACDVESPLLGPRGCSRVFGPQKGATPEMLPVLEEGMERWAAIVAAHAARTRPGIAAGVPLADRAGSGAAGGTAFALAALLGARLERGAAWVASTVGLDARLEGADLVVTGEGRLDGQSMAGKVVAEVTARARRVVPSARVAAVAGQVGHDLPADHGLDLVIDAAEGRAVDRATLAARGAEDLRRAGARALRAHLEVGSS